MLLSGQHILCELKTNWMVLREGSLPLPDGLPPPLLWQRGMEMLPGNLYLTDDPGPVPPCPEGMVICCGQRQCLGAAAVVPQPDLRQIFGFLQQRYADLARWDARMEVLAEGDSLQQLLDAASAVTGNVLTVTSAGLEMLCISENGKRPGKTGEAWTRPLNTADLAAIKEPMAAAREKAGVQWIRRPDWEYEFLYANLLEGRAKLGNIALLPAERPLEMRDVCLLERVLTHVLRLVRRLARQGDGSMASLHRGLRQLLEGTPPSPEKLEYWQAAAGFDREDPYVCLVIGLPSAVQNEYRGILSRDILTQLPRAILFSLENDLVLVVNVGQTPDLTGFFRWLEDYLARIDLAAGISDRLIDLQTLGDHYRQAKAALELGKGPLRRFSHCRQAYVLDRCRGNLSARLLYTPGFCRVLAHNTDSAVDYPETLRVWLEEGGNDSRAAARLHICRNTFLYRKKQLQTLLEGEADTADGRFYLMLCLRLWELSEKL